MSYEDTWDKVDWDSRNEKKINEQVKDLIRKGAVLDVRRKIGYKRTVLMRAIEDGYTQVSQTLIHAGADVNAQDAEGYTPLMKASSRGMNDVVFSLIQAGAKVNYQSDYSKSSPLYLAALYNQRDVVRTLISSGAKINAQDSYGRTPLIAAASRGHTGIVEDLIVVRANIHITDFDKRTALNHAASQGYTETAKLLEMADKNNLTPEQKIERIKWYKEQIRRLTAKPYAAERRELAKKLTSLRKEFGHKAKKYALDSRIVQELRKKIYTC